ncbi:L-threonylcarbamoyladenylate synthase [Deinococcus sp. Arct2-2]|uniref:L-threonylcarbamoyladenylate synthase n=1 Tax=Deinococcus sp. Arct2-2 TaxID=2568653 RepID=UPI0010A2BDFA|nr:L-threonylcarbamoyladenylate synthase [Deinococcus sp. Arct2-2]THF69977.1 L-threonylcarbamoyladenylate synthase [Deinococcus sp. Arct2-2]
MQLSPSSSQLTPQLRQAISALEAGQIVGYPSETVWGLAAHAARPGAVEALTLRKGREVGKPIQVSCLDLEAVRAVAHWNPALEVLAPFWPGPLTVVTAALPSCPPDLAPGGWVGVRVPAHPVIQALLARCGGLLATTSLNPSGHPAARTFAEAQAYALADLLLTDSQNGEDAPAGVASTVIQLPNIGLPNTGQRVARVLREGGLPVAVLAEALARVGVHLAPIEQPK